MKSLTIFANAKINLGLEILNLREDNYHNINTIFAPISLQDELNITKSDSYELICNVNFNLPPEKNLALKSAMLLNNILGRNDKVKIELKKNIPSGAGLGGGSSDAAAVLMGMNALFGYGLKKNEIAKIALEIGSDVPFFIYNQIAHASGRGEILEFIQFNLPYHILLIFPNISISTADAYKAFSRGAQQTKRSDFVSPLLSGDKARLKTDIFNDFEETAIKNNPEIGTIKDALYKYGSVFALMSGSGSSVFGLFEDEESAACARTKFSQVQTFICKFI